jgi:hypothetical protein
MEAASLLSVRLRNDALAAGSGSTVARGVLLAPFRPPPAHVMLFGPVALEREPKPTQHPQGRDKQNDRADKNEGWHHNPSPRGRE